LKALLARKKQFEGSKSYLEYLGGAAGPKDNFEGSKPYLKYLEGAAGPKGQFEGPKPCLEYLEGVAGPKGQFEGPKPCLEYLKGAAGPKGQLETISIGNVPQRSKHPLLKESRSKRSAKDRVVKKLCVCLGNTKEGSTENSKETQLRSHPRARGTYL
jgi:hypothetical protein